MAELSEQLAVWWTDHRPDREPLASVDVPPLLPDPGDLFTVRAQLDQGHGVFFSCRVARAPRLLRGNTQVVKFEVLDFNTIKEPR